jgi:hypothetical protein
MSNRATWIVALVSVALVAIGLVAWRTWDPSKTAPALDGGIPGLERVRFESPDMSVDLADLKVTFNPDYTEWVCLVVCRERGGCRGDVRLEIEYLSQEDERKINIAGRFAADRGETMRIGRVQRPPQEISRIERMTLVVEGVLPPVDVVPTPMM